MAEQLPTWAQWLISQGVAVGMLIWFMTRMETKIQLLIDKVEELCREVGSSRLK